MIRKIIFITQNFGSFSNGPGTYASYLWKGFKDDEDFEFHMVCSRSEFSHPRIHVVPAEVKKSGSIVSSLREYNLLANYSIEVADKLGGDIILHSNNSFITSGIVNSSYPVIGQINDYDNAEIFKKLPYILKEFGFRRVVSLLGRFFKERITVRNQTVTICNSNFTASIISKAYNPKPSTLKTIYKAVDIDFFMRPEIVPEDVVPQRSSGFKLLFTGSNWRRKGLKLLLKALGDLPPGINLTILGPSEMDYKAHIQLLIDRYNLAGRIFYLSKISRDDLRTVMWNSDAFILPSEAEALGVVLLEAMAASLPVVATRVGGIPEIICSPDCGLLVDYGNVEQLAASILQLTQNSDLYDKLSKRGLQNVQRFSSKLMLQNVKKEYFNIFK